VPTTHNGTASLSGSGTVTPHGTAVRRKSAALSGSGTFTAHEQHEFPVAALSGSGTITSAGQRKIPVTFQAGASLTVSALVIKNAVAALAAAPVLTAAGLVPTMTAHPSLTAVAKVTEVSAAAFRAPGTLSAGTSQSAAHLSAGPVLLAPGRMAAARLLAGTSMSVSGTYFLPGAASLFAGPVLHAAAKVTELPSVHLSAPASLTAPSSLRVPAAAALHAGAALTAAPFSASAHLSAAAALSAAGTGTDFAHAALSAPGSVAFHGQVTREPRAALSGSGTMHPRSTTVKFASAALRASAVLRAAGTRGVAAHSALSAAAALSAGALRSAAARAALSAQASALISAQVTSGARLSAAASLSGSAVLSRAVKATLSSSAGLTATAHGTALPRAALTAPGTLASVPLGVVKGGEALAASPSLRAAADTRPKLPFPPPPGGQQPSWERDVQRFAIVQERQRHAQALWQYGELVMFALLWKPEDITAGLARRCTRCYTPGQVINDLPPETPPPLGWPTASTEAQISAAYGQGSQFRCLLCFGTQVIAAGTVKVPGVRALLVRSAVLTDTDQNQQRTARGVVNTGSVQVQSTPDFRVHTLDYLFRSDGRRYQLSVPARTTLRTGFGSPWQASAGISYNVSNASLEDPDASVAYAIAPLAAELAQVLGTYTRVPADYAWVEQVNGPLIPGEDPPPAAYGMYQPPASLGVLSLPKSSNSPSRTPARKSRHSSSV
jgi:hypothetical protein